jgi:gamma-glutamyltranspeptidase/glutathione hydrolase
MPVAVASSSPIAADAGAAIAAVGGNAIDAALAAVLVSANTEPGIVSLAGGGFVTVWTRDDDPITIDGYGEMPGRGLPRDRFGRGAVEVHIDYGGGVTTLVGHGTVATPGALAALGVASRRHGRLPWRELFSPAVGYAEQGFSLPTASHLYLRTSHESIFGWHEPSREAIHRGDGSLLDAGELVRVPHLAGTLRQIAEEGPEAFYRGDLAHRLVAGMEENGGILTLQDLAEYDPVVRRPILADLDAWTLATNPPPAVGGATLAAMLLLARDYPWQEWDATQTRRMIDIQSDVLGYRRRHIDRSRDVPAEARVLLEAARRGDVAALRSASTVHTSAVDESGGGCAVTISMGYGSGVMPPGTGLWMNNHLGEMELNRFGFHALEPGTRLVSNMAPTVTRRRDGAVLAVGSPGADRIPTAILHTVLNATRAGMALAEAIRHPRLHVEEGDSGPRVAYEAGLPVDELGVSSRLFDRLDMFFGGVAAASWTPEGGLVAAADPRRTGGVAFG